MTGRRRRESGSRGRKAEEEDPRRSLLALPSLLEPGPHLAHLGDLELSGGQTSSVGGTPTTTALGLLVPQPSQQQSSLRGVSYGASSLAQQAELTGKR